MQQDDRLLSSPPPASQKQKHADTQHRSASQVETNNTMTVAVTAPSVSPSDATSSKDNALLAFQHHKEVEGRKRSGLSIRRLQQHLSEFKFEPSAIPFPSSDDSRTSSSTHTSDDEDSSGDERREDGSMAVPPGSVSTKRASPTIIRSKFLNKLGISPAKDEQEKQQQLAMNAGRRDIPVRRPAEASYETELNDVVRQRQQEAAAAAAAAAKKSGPFAFFKASNFSSDASSASASSSLSEENDDSQPPAVGEATEKDANQDNQKRTLRFAPIVKVHPIPRHTAYSKRVRETVWTSAKEMEEEVARNCIEFAAEDWDYQKVLEEQDMVGYHGQLVHPVHFGT